MIFMTEAASRMMEKLVFLSRIILVYFMYPSRGSKVHLESVIIFLNKRFEQHVVSLCYPASKPI